jgi:hypothetical protein
LASTGSRSATSRIAAAREILLTGSPSRVDADAP